MRSADAYAELIAYLNDTDEELQNRKLHRLSQDNYTASDSEFFFTICARQHGKPFADERLAKAIIEALMWRKGKHGWHLFCYCLMPDHLHFILRLLEHEVRMLDAGGRGVVQEGILEQIGAFKSYTTTQIWWKMGGQGLLWQKSSYDRVIRYNDSVEDAANYVLNNSVRKNLVEVWTEYPYADIVDEW